MPDCLNHVQALGAVADFGMWRGARRQVPLDTIALPTGTDLPAGAYERAEENALLGHRGGGLRMTDTGAARIPFR